MANHPDVLIIGGGVIGLTAAYFLVREGMRVELVDQGDFGQEASWAGAGIIPPGDPTKARTPFEQLRAHSFVLFPRLSAELKQETGIDNGFLPSGGLVFHDEGNDYFAREWRGEGIAVEEVQGQELTRLEPALGPGQTRAYFLPQTSQLRNPRHLKALLAFCRKRGVQLRPGCPVVGLEREGSRITAARTGAETIHAGRYLLAAGAWSGGLLEALGCRLGIRPVRGQIALLNTGAAVFQRILLKGKRYMVPRPDGRVLIGSTEEDAGFDKRTTAGAIHGLLDFAIQMVPSLVDIPLERCWAGLRPGSADGLPYLGSVPGIDNLFVAAGHFRAGIQLSPATGLVLKELFLGQKLTVALEPFRLDRGLPSQR
jgi:glycine oxidase